MLGGRAAGDWSMHPFILGHLGGILRRIPRGFLGRPPGNSQSPGGIPHGPGADPRVPPRVSPRDSPQGAISLPVKGIWRCGGAISFQGIPQGPPWGIADRLGVPRVWGPQEVGSTNNELV